MFIDRGFTSSPGLARARLRSAVGIALIFYTVTLIVFVLGGILRGHYNYTDIYRVGIPMMVVDGALAFLLFFLLEGTARLASIARWIIVVCGVLAVAALQSAWDTQLRIWSGSVWADYGTPYDAFIRSGMLNAWHTGLFVALLGFQGANMALRDKQRQLIVSRAAERDAHLLALRFQLNPHFLFNTLNAISSLVVVGRTAEAEAMLERLASFLRASLTADPSSLVAIEEEFEMLDTYLDIEGVRFGERLVTEMDLPDHLSGHPIPPFLLQPLVENAIKYAVAPARRPVTVRIAARRQQERVVLSVIDDGEGCGDVAPGTGVGLANVRERLLLKYGTEAWLKKEQDGAGCRVEIVLPLDSRVGRAADGSVPAFA